MRNVEDAYDIAVLNLAARIERKEKEQTGVFDAIGNEVCSKEHIDLPIWKIAYLSEPIKADFFREHLPLTDADGEKILDLRAGVDSRFSMLLFLGRRLNIGNGRPMDGYLCRWIRYPYPNLALKHGLQPNH